jgi:hypothetical protein
MHQLICDALDDVLWDALGEMLHFFPRAFL